MKLVLARNVSHGIEGNSSAHECGAIHIDERQIRVERRRGSPLHKLQPDAWLKDRGMVGCRDGDRFNNLGYIVYVISQIDYQAARAVAICGEGDQVQGMLVLLD